MLFNEDELCKYVIDHRHVESLKTFFLVLGYQYVSGYVVLSFFIYFPKYVTCNAYRFTYFGSKNGNLIS